MSLLVLAIDWIVLGHASLNSWIKASRSRWLNVSKLRPNVILEKSKGKLDPEDRYWRLTRKARANGTQTIDTFVLEVLYHRKSGDTTMKECRDDEDYATLFKRSQEHKGMLLMISPKDGQVEATVEICEKRK